MHDPYCESLEPLRTGLSRFRVCEKCGNKRCPHAFRETYQCTGSNEPNQIGVHDYSKGIPMKTLILSLAFCAFVAFSANAQDCANGVCQRPIVRAIVAAPAAIIHTVPQVVHHAMHSPVQAVVRTTCAVKVHAQAAPVRRRLFGWR